MYDQCSFSFSWKLITIIPNDFFSILVHFHILSGTDCIICYSIYFSLCETVQRNPDLRDPYFKVFLLRPPPSRSKPNPRMSYA
jgi:hypothetical protein